MGKFLSDTITLKKGFTVLWNLVAEIKITYGNLGKIVVQTYNQAQ